MFLYLDVLDPNYTLSQDWDAINSKFLFKFGEWHPGQNLFKNVIQTKWGSDRYAAFIIYIAVIYKETLVQNVKDRGWEKFWIPLSHDYKEWKIKKGRYPNIWMSTGKLIDSVGIYPDWSRQQIMIGIKENVWYKSKYGSIPVLWVAKWLEYGTSRGLPSRPLFRRTRDMISKNISRYYEDFKLMLENLDL